MRTYESWGSQMVASGSSARAQSLFVLAWFHAIIQERRLFIPHGWTKFYEFTTADLRSAVHVISRVCEVPAQDGSIVWDDVHGKMSSLHVFRSLISSTVPSRFHLVLLL
jgi:dynein heavy chain 2, cytosolic